MSYFKWTSDLDVGVEELNNQHKELIARMETVYQTNLSDTKDKIVAAIQHLLECVVEHFTYEEGYLASINYPTLAAHKQIHKNLVTDMSAFAESFTKGSSEKLGDEFMAFLDMWVTTHITVIDGKYNPDDQ